MITKEWIDEYDSIVQQKLQPLSDVKIVRILNSVPQDWESLLTYTIGTEVHNFKPGDEVRISKEDSYEYYKLYSVENNIATWKVLNEKASSTIVVNLQAIVNGNLVSNSDLNNAIVTVQSDTTINKLWNGNQLIFDNLSPIKQYTVSVSNVDGYNTPLSYTISNIGIGQTVSHNFQYTADEYTFDIQSNQTDDETIAAVVGTISYTGGSKTSHTSVKVPTGTEVTVSFPDVTGYKKTVSNQEKIYTTLYQTEIVTVEVSTDQEGISTEGRIVTINGENLTVPVSGIVSIKVASDTIYSVTISDWPTGGDKYNTPDVTNYASLTASSSSNASRYISLIYTLRTEEVVTGYIIDQSDTTASPDDYIVKDVPAMNSTDEDDVIHRIWSNTKLFAAATSLSNGKLQTRELSRDNKSQWADGTAVVNNTTYDKFMKLPEFWWHCEEVAANTDRWKIDFTMDNPNDASWNHWDGNTFIGVYEAYISGNLVYSRKGYTPTGNVSWSNFKVYATARGTGYSLVTYEAHQIMALLGYGWLGTTDGQSIVGYGSNENNKVTGKCDAKGIYDTSAAVDGGNTAGGGSNISINFWGLENWWGNKCEWVDNIQTANNSGLINILIPGSSTVNRTVQTTTGNDCMTKTTMGDKGDMISKAYVSDSTYSKGYASVGAVRASAGWVAYRSGFYSVTSSGLSCLYVNVQADDSDALTVIGSRLLYHGDWEENNTLT